MPSGYISMNYNLKGPSYSTVSACASGAHAIGESFRLIQHGQADVMVTGGTEATICQTAIEGFTSCRALSLKFNDEPEKSSRPFDEERDGFVMAEGAGTIILEELEHAKRRDANILCEMPFNKYYDIMGILILKLEKKVWNNFLLLLFQILPSARAHTHTRFSIFW